MTTRRLDTVLQLVLSLHAAVTDALSARLGGSRERGDVPGWVLVTLMTAGLVTVLWTLAGTTLQTMFTSAVAGVTGPGAG